MIKDALSMRWLTSDFFLYGWGFFFEQETQALLVWSLIVVAVNFFLGCCWSTLPYQLLLLILLRRIIVGGICTSNKRLDGQVVVITGSNTGIGKETAKDLSRRGAKVILACRDTKKAEKAATEIMKETAGKVDYMKLDLSSLESVREFAKELQIKEPNVHMLINNAGVLMWQLMQTSEGFEMQMGTNHLGHFLLTRLLLPCLTIHGKPARIINVSSLGHIGGEIPFDDFNYEKKYQGMKGYANSKLANILFTRQLSKFVRESNIQVFALHPGVVKTELGRKIPFSDLMAFVTQFFYKNAEEGSQTTIYCATEAKEQEPFYYSDCELCIPAAVARDDDVAEKLWQLSEKLVGLVK